MKFRAKITDPQNIKTFAHLISTLHKFSRTMVLHLLPDKMAFFMAGKGGSCGHNVTTMMDTQAGVEAVGAVMGGSTAWAEVPAEVYFEEYNMDGVSEANNQILMFIATDMFSSSLSTLKGSNNVACVKLKLTKQHSACLTLEIDSSTMLTNFVCKHDIPVEIVHRKNWAEYQRPDVPRFNIRTEGIDMRQLRLTMERLKGISPKIVFKMDKEGKLVISVMTYTIQCTVDFTNLHAVPDDENEEELPMTPVLNGSEEYSVEVDTKSVVPMIPSDGYKPTRVICSILDGRMLHWILNFGDISVQYFIPGSAAV